MKYYGIKLFQYIKDFISFVHDENFHQIYFNINESFASNKIPYFVLLPYLWGVQNAMRLFMALARLKSNVPITALLLFTF